MQPRSWVATDRSWGPILRARGPAVYQGRYTRTPDADQGSETPGTANQQHTSVTQQLCQQTHMSLRALQLALLGPQQLSIRLQAALTGCSRYTTSSCTRDSMDFPGGPIHFTSAMSFQGGPATPDAPRIPCYRTLDQTGQPLPEADVPHPLDQSTAVELYTAMARLQTMDTIFYEAQRQGRFSFYMTSAGEEATIVGSAAALDPKDMVFSQYREQGVLLWRGFSFRDFADQCYGNKLEAGKGRQMPIHYGSKDLCYHTVSSPLATQLPHAVGAAYAMKLQQAPTVAATYFGEGASSEGDFHAALNFAATLEAPCLFICRNNGYAISTPASEQYRGDGVACRGPSYGMAAIRVDGGDARAVFNATREARRLALQYNAPVLIEAMSYRSGHHSTSDDSSRYRTKEEMASWRARDPVVRFRNWLVSEGWWDEAQEKEARRTYRQQVMAALDEASQVEKPALSNLFTDVYADMPWHLREQMQATMDFAKRHPEVVPQGVPVK